ncbi:hypothetical protein P0136_02510 [Lentisphaerota bacterium ZTH]|nr:hypothetical protein JYG24_06350 [Lentisphaerota bacterium]WET06874.1 hypothetical protein P0136_02510 [Lentisphaerota bacterium ZTH]
MDPIVILIGIVMFVALIGMIICSKKQKTNPNAQPFAIALLIIVIICGIAMMFKTGLFGGGGIERFREIENRYYASQGFVVGEFIKKNMPGEKILVIAENNFKKDKRVQALVEELQNAAGSKSVVKVDTVSIGKNKTNAKNPPPEVVDMPLYELMTPADFDLVINKHSDCNVVISLIGLPRNASKLSLWRKGEKSRPKLILVGPNDMTGLDKAIERNMISAVVIMNPLAKFSEEAPPADPEKTFKLRYLLIDRKNLKANAKVFR